MAGRCGSSTLTPAPTSSAVELLRREFTENRFWRRESQDLLMRMQVIDKTISLSHARADLLGLTINLIQ